MMNIPVCYGGEFGPDLETVARINHLTPEEVIHIHTLNRLFGVYVGFCPWIPLYGRDV